MIFKNEDMIKEKRIKVVMTPAGTAWSAEKEYIDVLVLPRAENVQDGDTLLLVRQNADGTQACYRVDGMTFHGEDTYDIAKAGGYTGTREEWEEQIRRASNVDVTFDAKIGEIVISQ